MTDATPAGTSSNLAGTDGLLPYLTTSPSTESRGATRARSYIVPLSTTRHPAAWSSARRSSAVVQSRARRAAAPGLGEGDDLGRCDVTGHASEDTATEACLAAQPTFNAVTVPAPMTASDRIQVWASPLYSIEPVRQSSQP